MYLLRGIPIKRAIPGGELAYISRTKFSPGSVLPVPIKKSTELILVTECNSILDEKEYIKSLPYKLVTIEKPKAIFEFKKDVLTAIQKFSSYSICPIDKIVRALMSKIDFTKDTIPDGITDFTIKSTGAIEKNTGIIPFHKFILIFSKNSKKIDQLYLQNPARLSLYGSEYLGFDPLPLFPILNKYFEYKLVFNGSYKRLSYKEWDIKYKKNIENDGKQGKLIVLNREDEKHAEKANPLATDFIDILERSLAKDKKILLLGTAKNFASRSSCSDCGTVHKCSTCTGAFVLVKNNRNYAKKYGIAGEYIFVCPNCKIAENSIAKCKNCDSWNLTPLGFGIERIHEYLVKSLDKKETKRIYDFTNGVKKLDFKKWQTDGGLIIGPLNLLHEIDQTDVLMVPSLSVLLYGENYDAVEKANDIIYYSKNNTVYSYISVMQNSEKEFLQKDMEDWQKNELADRKVLHYPPFCRFVVFSLDNYASKSKIVKDGLISIIKKYALPETVSIKENINGTVTIRASFDKEFWQIKDMSLKTPNMLNDKLAPFMKYLKITVY